MQVVLASLSPYRRAQLTAFGVPFLPQAPRVDEEKLKLEGPRDLKELTRFLARKKAESIAGEYYDGVVIGSDQLAEFNGERLDKPGTREKAFMQLKKLAGQTHSLITSIAVFYRDQVLIETEVTRITMRALDERVLNAYLDLDQPFDCAGSYKVEKGGLALVEKVDGEDPSAIQGLPLIALTRCFWKLGLSPAQLWSSK